MMVPYVAAREMGVGDAELTIGLGGRGEHASANTPFPWMDLGYCNRARGSQARAMDGNRFQPGREIGRRLNPL